ncbi:MAG TPA: hypothetical protein VGX23_15025 [Actinocrinis sp.]|nr:hypothetical protein [Actinocrinis sp.]
MPEDQPPPPADDTVEASPVGVRRLNRRLLLLGLATLLLVAPFNLLCTMISALIEAGDLSSSRGKGPFLSPIQWPTFVAACYCAIIGLAAVLVPRWLPSSDRGTTIRRAATRAVFAGLCSALVGVLCLIVASGSG